MDYVIGGFSNCGIHSLAEYLKLQGHRVIQMYGNLASKEFEIILHQELRKGNKLIFITRKDNKYKIDCEKELKRIEGIDYEVVSLEEMKKKSDFPKLNESDNNGS